MSRGATGRCRCCRAPLTRHRVGTPRRSAVTCRYFNYLLSKVPSDPGALSRLGHIYSKDEDEAGAFHYHFESYRYYPVNLEVISWLGVWYVKSELYEKAIEFFERAAEIQPTEVSRVVVWLVRRLGSRCHLCRCLTFPACALSGLARRSGS